MIAINIDPSLALVTLKFSGFTTANDLIRAMNYCASSELWKDHYNYFLDIREIEVGFSIADYPMLIENIAKLKPKKYTKHACVVEGHTHFAFTLAWEQMAALHDIRFKSSFSCDELAEWLGIRASEIAQIFEAKPLFSITNDEDEFQPQY